MLIYCRHMYIYIYTLYIDNRVSLSLSPLSPSLSLSGLGCLAVSEKCPYCDKLLTIVMCVLCCRVCGQAYIDSYYLQHEKASTVDLQIQ